MAPRKTTNEKSAASLRKLPPALRKNAQGLVSEARARQKIRALAALADAKSAYAESLRGLYELGKALTTLAEDGMAKAAGFPKGFTSLCQTLFAMDELTAHRLVRAASHVTEERFSSLGVHQVNARLDLATATEADDTAAILAGKTVALWKGGPSVDVGKASVRALVGATKSVRAHLAAKAGKKLKGRTTTPAERKAAETATRALSKRGCAAATVKVFATKPGAPSRFVIDGLSQPELEALLKA